MLCFKNVCRVTLIFFCFPFFILPPLVNYISYSASIVSVILSDEFVKMLNESGNALNCHITSLQEVTSSEDRVTITNRQAGY
jgi:hypothetical protein